MVEDLPKLIDINFIEQFKGKTISVFDTIAFDLFEIKRIYWINYHNVNNNISQHAHLKTKQLLIAVEGELSISLENLDGDFFHFILNKSSQALYIPNYYWKTISYNNNCVLLSMASEVYFEEDYIRDYDDFMNLKKLSAK